MNTNGLGFEERLAAGKRQEAAVIVDLQRMFWSVIPATDEQDIKEKVDCWVRWKGVSYSVAIKYRESGTDLGLALVRPWTGMEAYRELFVADALPYDRDFKHVTDLYAVAVPSGLVIVTGISVYRTCKEALLNLAEHGEDGMQDDAYALKVVTDKGASGHTAGQKKLIAYLKTDALERVEV